MASSVNLRAAAELELRLNPLANNSIASYSSEVNLYVEICKKGGEGPWPVTDKNIRLFAAILKVCQDRSAAS